MNFPVVREFYLAGGPSYSVQWGILFADAGVWLYMAVEAIRDSLPFMPAGSDLELYSNLCDELRIQEPYSSTDAIENIQETTHRVKEKHIISLEMKAFFCGFRLEVRRDKNAPFNGVFLFCRDFISLISWINKHVIDKPYKSNILTRFAGSMSTIKEVKPRLPYSDCNFFLKMRYVN